MPSIGIGGALSTIVGQNIGANNIERAEQAFKKSVKLTTIIMMISGLLFLPITEWCIMVFSKNPYVISEGDYYLKLILLTLPFLGVFSCLNGLFQGSGHTVSSMIISMGRLWFIRLPMLLLIQKMQIKDPRYIWYAMISSNIIIVVVGTLIYLTGRWKKPVVKKRRIISKLQDT